MSKHYSSAQLELCNVIYFVFADDWKHDVNDAPGFIRKVDKIQLTPPFVDEKLSPTRYRENPPSYIFPKEPLNDIKGQLKYNKERLDKPIYRKKISVEEDQPIIISKQVKEVYKHDNVKKQYPEPIKSKAQVEDERKLNGGLMRQQSERYRQATDRMDYNRKYGPTFDNYEKYERENLTDRQKYREIIENKKYQKRPDESPMRVEMHRLNDYKKESRDYSPEHVRTIQRKSRSSDRYEGHEVPVERNPYRESESLPYRQSIESMMKSPVMKYKSRVAYDRRSPSPTADMYSRDLRKQSNRSFNNSSRRLDQNRDHYVKDASPMSTMKKTSPKDRFQDAKEKFQAMEKIRLQQEPKPVLSVRRSEPSRYDKDYRQSYSPEPRYPNPNEWSSEEEFSTNVRDYREVLPHRPTHYHQPQQRMNPAKSLGNLAKGYRHSYAEPMKYCNRVGLAAISLDPY